MSDAEDAVAPNLAAAMGSIKRQLQAEPQRYWLFGLWWWWVKAELARRYGPVEMPILGSYVDAEQAAIVGAFAADMDDDGRLVAALREADFNTRYPRPSHRVEWGSEIYAVNDPDVDG